MAEVKWIKICTEIFDDETIKLIESMPEGDTIIVIWFKLLIQAGKINDSGYVYFKKDLPFTDEMLSTVFRRPINVVRLALQTFVKFGMVEICNTQEIFISNWGKHQNIEGLERIKEQTKARVARHREKQKLLGNVTVTQGNATDIDKNKKENILYINNQHQKISPESKIINDVVDLYKKQTGGRVALSQNQRVLLTKIIQDVINQGLEPVEFFTIVFEKLSKLKFKFANNQERKPKFSHILKNDNAFKIYNGECDDWIEKIQNNPCIDENDPEFMKFCSNY